MKKMFLISLMIGGFVLLLAAPSIAVHKGAGELTCGACHTMHNSQGWDPGNSELNTGTPANGSIVLLRGPVSSRAEIHNLCLQCHAEDGAQAGVVQQPHGNTAPKVYRTTAWGGSGFDDIGAGGDFSSTMTKSGNTYVIATAEDGSGGCVMGTGTPSIGKGHSLGCQTVTPPGASETAMNELTCTNCHDPHGYQWDGANYASSKNVNLYRILKGEAPGGGGGAAFDPDGAVILSNINTYVGGAEALVSKGSGVPGPGARFDGSGTPTAADHYWPLYDGVNGQNTGNQNAYFSGGVAGEASVTTTGIAGWCAQCHDQWHEDGQGGTNPTGNDWKRHPVNNPIVESGSELSGANVTIVDWTHYDTNVTVPNKVPAAQTQTPTGYDGGAGNTYYADSNDDRVFCFSCHFVHGGPYYDNLRWDYLAAVTTGSQTGNSVGSLIGCQQCHNR